MLVEHLINLSRVDVFPAANNHVTLPVNDVVKAISVPVADIACVKPAIPESSRSRVRVLVITLQDVLAPQHYLSELAVRHFIIFVIYHLHLITDGDSTRSRPATLIRRIKGGAAS